MKLVLVSLADLPLYEAMFCDPQHMAELGGAHPLEKVPEILAKHMACNEKNTGWVFKFVPTEEDVTAEELENDTVLASGVGTVCIWEGEWNGNPVTEMGWGVMTKYQGRGFGTKGVKLMLQKAAELSERWGVIHAFTGVTNKSSNAMCKSVGFSLLGECDIDYDERPLHVNHYTYDTAAVAVSVT